jgi:hypothetical protein
LVSIAFKYYTNEKKSGIHVIIEKHQTFWNLLLLLLTQTGTAGSVWQPNKPRLSSSVRMSLNFKGLISFIELNVDDQTVMNLKIRLTFTHVTLNPFQLVWYLRRTLLRHTFYLWHRFLLPLKS